MTLPADTSQAAAQAQAKALRAMGLAGRAELTFRLCDNLRNITIAGIRHRHPNYTDPQIIQVYCRLILPPPLFQQVFPGCEITA